MVKELLLNWGASEDSINSSAYGETKPVADNRTAEGKQLNRRVQITAHYVEDTSTIWQLLRQLDSGYQTFNIDNSRDTLLQAEQGTFIKIPARAFDCNGKKITVRLKEAFNTADIIKNNLSTTSNGKILETRGMIYVDAMCGDQPVELRRGRSIVSIIPVEDPVPALVGFNGERNPHDSVINWREDPTPPLLFSNFDIGFCCGNTNEKCPFFFCKIRRWLSLNQSTAPTLSVRSERRDPCENIGQLLAHFGIDLNSEEQLRLAFARYQVDDLESLTDKLRKIRNAELDEEVFAGRASESEFKNFVSRHTELGWRNIDYFTNFPEEDLITMRTGIRKDKHTQLFLVFKDQRIILPPHNSGTEFYFKDVPEKEAVKLLALRHTHGKAMIATADFEIGKHCPPMDFREVSLEKLKLEINSLSGRPTTLAVAN